MKKSIKVKALEKKYLKLLQHQKDKEFFKSCYTEDEGFYELKKDLSKEDKKKLKQLHKAIKANRKGAVKFLPLIIFGAIVAGIVFFFTTIANPLLGHLLEKGLEAAFEAKCDVRGFRLSFIKFQISIKSVTVANKDKPMKNLFEMGRTNIQLRPDAILRGKVYIEEIRADELRFGTDRKVSGALPGYVPKPKKQKEEIDAPPLIDLANFDAMALFNQEFNKLRTPKLYDEVIDLYNETTEKWKGEVDNVKNQVTDLNEAAKPLMDINLNNLKFSKETLSDDVAYIRGALNDINNMYTTVRSAADTATGIVNALENDINNVKQLERDARNSITGDIDYLKSFLDLGSGTAFEALEPFIRDVLDDTVEEYIEYGLIALETLEKIKADIDAVPKNEKPKKEKKVVFKGRDVIFPVKAYPTFYLGTLASDFTLNTWNWAFDLKDVTSHPDMIGKPVSLYLGLEEVDARLSRNVKFNGLADFRKNAPQRFGVDLTGAGFPFTIDNKFKKIGIGGFSGETAFNLNLAGYPERFSAASGINITEPSLNDPVGTVAKALADAVTQAGLVNLDISYAYNAQAKDEFKLKSNIAQIMLDALKKTAQAYAKRAMEEIEKLVRQKIEEYVGDRLNSEQVDQLLKIAKGDKEAIDQTRKDIESKKNELEQRLRAATGEAQEQIEQRIDDTKQQLQEAADQAKAEAEEKVKEEAKNLLQNLFPRRTGDKEEE